MAKILVIDDEEDMRLLMCAILARDMHEIESASSGEAALEIFSSARPDLILCDVSMRGMSGYEVLSRLREMPDGAHTAVVLVTGMADLKGMREGMNLGADDYLPKPFTVEELLAVVRTRIEKTQGLRKDSEQRAKSLRNQISLMLPQDLLNPLTGILGLAGTLCDEADGLRPEEAAEIARDIQLGGEKLNRRINNFLIYSQIELLSADPVRLAALRASPATSLAHTVEDAARSTAAKHGRDQDAVVATTDAEVAVSAQNLEKILGEILDNAFRFSPKGSPVRVEAGPVAGKALIRVSDRGAGLDPAMLQVIRMEGQMEHFSEKRAGTGLGLAIAVRLAEIHNGRVGLEEGAGPGACLFIELPLATPGP